MTITEEIITPKMAEEYLAMNTNNYRRLNKDRVAQYAADMRNGCWQENGEAIKFGKNGILLDGQNRLHAIVLANTPIKMYVIRGVESNIFDIGQARSLSQIANSDKTYGAVTNQMTGIANIMVNNFGPRSPMGKMAVVNYIKEHYDDIHQANTLITKKGQSLCRKSAIGVAAYIALRLKINCSVLSDFFKTANSGIPVGYKEPSPPLIFRNMIQNIGYNTEENKRLLFSACLDAINDYVMDKPRSRMYKMNPKSFELLDKIRKEDNLHTY